MLSQDVCPFVTRRCYVETAKFIIKLFFRQVYSGISLPNFIAIFRQGSPSGVVECREV